MKKLVVLFVILCTISAFAVRNEALWINENTFVPMRSLLEWLGTDKKYDNATKEITINNGKMNLTFTVGKEKASLNSVPYNFAQPAFNYQGQQVYVPIRDIAQALDFKMAKDEENQKLTVSRTGAAEPLIFDVVWLNPVDGSELVWVSAGSFIIGETSGAVGYLHRNKPVAMVNDPSIMNDITPYTSLPAHNVYTDGFWISKHEITAGQYQKFCNAMKRTMPSAPIIGYTTAIMKDSKGKTKSLITSKRGWRNDHPISMVTWFDAMAYADWIHGRLPTETEWEKAARGLDGRAYPWGDRYEPNKLNVSNDTPDRSRTLPVGSYPSGISPYGAMDMAGNVAEWCLDWLDRNDFVKWSNPVGLAGERRAIRGGSWMPSGNTYEVFCRWRKSPIEKMADVGFRVVIPATPASRQSVDVSQAHQSIKIFDNDIPADYRVAEAWTADILDNGGSETVVIAVPKAENDKLFPILKIFKLEGVMPKMKAIQLQEYKFDEKQLDGTSRWRSLMGDKNDGGIIPTGYFGIRDLNADGKLEIYVMLRSGDSKSLIHDEILYILSTDDKLAINQIGAIVLQRADRGGWMVDDMSKQFSGLEVCTFSQKADINDYVIKPRPFSMTYYGFIDGKYQKYFSKNTRESYLKGDDLMKDVKF
jgi:formylglycine-generating enzyme required for sulfatase activity